MLSAEKLGVLVEALQRALGIQRFASLSFLLCGDFIQLPPVGATSLYTAMLSGTTPVGLWLRKFQVITLTENMRCDPADVEWAQFLARICDPRQQPFPKDVIAKLCQLSPDVVLKDPEFVGAQFATPDNATRAMVNRAQAVADAKRLGVPLLAWYLPVSKPSSSALRHPDVPLDLLVEPEVLLGVQKAVPDLLQLFFPGGRAVITENQSVPHRVVNSE
jgi:hypothetical protein